MNIHDMVEQAQLETRYKNSKDCRKVFEFFEEDLERFAELIRQDEAKSCAEHYLKIMSIAIDSARKGEREACAALCDAECNQQEPMKIISTFDSGCYVTAEFLANEIRSRK